MSLELSLSRWAHSGPVLCRAAFPLLLLASVSACGSRSSPEVPDAQRDVVPADVVDPDVEIPVPPVICIEVRPEAPPVLAELTTPVSLAVVDLFFLIDATASMTDEIDNVRTGLRTVVVPGVLRAIPDAQFGLGLVGEFPVEPFGPPMVRPYELRVPIGGEITMLEGSLSRLPEWGNFDDPEAHVEALYQVATGDGLGEFISPSFGCPNGGEGGVCFRDDAFRIVMLITDAPFHNGPDGAEPYEGIEPAPHDYDEMVTQLARLDVRVVGLGASDLGRPPPLPDLRRLASDTRALTASGGPLVFDIGSRGDGVGSGIVDAIERLATGLTLDVDAVFRGSPGGDFDPEEIVRSVRPIRALPSSGVRSLNGDTAIGVLPGTQLVFQVEVDASALLPERPETRRAFGSVVFRAFGRSRLGERRVEIVIPGLDGGGCEP